jgi:hypothetical protein
MIVYKNMFQGSTSNFEPTCSIGQETFKFYLSESENYLSESERYLSEVLLTSNM